MDRTLRENLALVAAVNPGALTANTYDSDDVDMAKYEHILAIVMTGTIGSSGTIDAKLQTAPDNGGYAGAYVDLPSGAITQLSLANGDSNKQAEIELDRAKLPATHRWARLRLTVGVATSGAGAVVLGGNPRQAPITNKTSVKEVVTTVGN